MNSSPVELGSVGSGLSVLHVTESSAGGVLQAVATSANAQALSSDFGGVSFAYICRQDTPNEEKVSSLFSAGVSVERISAALHLGKYFSLLRWVEAAHSDFQVVHVHSSKAGLVLRSASSRSLRDKLVYTAHGLSFQHGGVRAARPAYRLAEKYCWLRVPRVIAVSRSEAGALNTGVGAQSIVVPNAFDLGTTAVPLQSVNSRKRQGIRPVVRIVHVGRLCQGKLPGLFARTAASVSAEMSKLGFDCDFVWVGEGDRSLLEGQDHVRCTGWLDRGELYEVLGSADLLLFTSQGEGMPLTVLEAQALRVPVVASNVHGVVDLIDHDSNGYLGGSPAELCKHVVTLLTCCDTRHRIIEEASNRVMERHSAATVAASFYNAYTKLVPQRCVTA